MRVLADPKLRERMVVGALLCVALWMVLFGDPTLALASTGKIKLANLGKDVFNSFAEYSTWAGAALFAAGAIPAMSGRDVGAFAMGAMGTGAGVASVQYIPDLIGVIGKTHGALV